MAKLRLLLLVAACSPWISAQEKTTLEVGHYLGPVQSVRTETVRSVPGGAPRTVGVTETILDTHGNSTSSISYGEDGQVRQRLAWKSMYDDRGRLFKRLYFNAEGQLTNTGVYTYREADRTIELVQINPDESINHHATRLYDAAGNLLEETRHYPDRGNFKDEMAYNEKGNLTERRSYTEGKLVIRSVWKYDDYGNTTEWTIYQADGTTRSMIQRTLECDAKGNITRVVNLNPNGSVRSIDTITYTFDDHGNWTAMVTTHATAAGVVVGSEATYRTFTYY